MGSRLEFQILGPLEVLLDDAPVRVGGPRQRALLALLLCSANRVVSRERLIDGLLGDQAADSAEQTIRVQVSRLRKALADGGHDGDPRLVATPPGYMLRVDPGELDLQAFEQHIADGRRALKHDDPQHAAMVLREAEAMWRGRPLADLEFEPFARLEVQRLEDLRLYAVEERIDAELELGEHAALCPELESLVAEHPLRERLRSQLMLALYRSSRQADALAAYTAGRSLLVGELALEPGPQLRQLQKAILEHDPALELPRAVGRVGSALAGAAPAQQAPPVQAARSADDTVAHEPQLEPMPQPGQRHRAGWMAVTLAVFAALVVLAIVEGAGGSNDPHGAVSGNALVLMSPVDGAIEATVPLSAPPTDVAAGFGSLWVTEASTGLLVRVDAQRRKVIATIPVGARPSRVITADGRVWVLDPVNGTVSAYDADTGTVAQTSRVGQDPSDLVFRDGSVWVADKGDGTVVRLNPDTGLTEKVVRVGADPSGLATTAGAVWVADDESGMVERIDALTDKITAQIRVGDAPAAISATPAAIWVLDPLDATLSKVNLLRDTVTATTALGGEPSSLAPSGGHLWVGDTQLGAMDRIDAGSATVTNTIRVARPVSALTAAGGLWAAVDAGGTGHLGGTLTTSNYQNLDTVDPAASTAWNVTPPAGLGLTNDGLVTLDHVAGPGGLRLVPDLAMALPEPTDNGLTYTFKLRPGIHYSTGALVEPSDVAHSFQRLFAIRSSGAALFQAIVGASACTRTPIRCDLSAGIVADDRAGTVTFHLTRADPDFLYKLTIAYADVLPASTPNSEAQTPLPATGPYMITRYIPGREAVLTRNPDFREWSAAAQPDGYPNQIVLRLDLTGANAAGAVATGAADFMANLGQPPGKYSAYFLRDHRGQVRVNRLMDTNFLFLNMHAPPFNDVRVRQALNLALDRGAVVNSYGGPIAASPTCQILPPGMPGYLPYCPYSRDPTASGRWRGPNLPLAKRLVAASGTAGMKVTVWDGSGPQPPDVPYTVTALRQLGYRASVRLLPDSTYFTYANNSHNQAQVIDGGWGADYPIADDYIGKLTCSYFVPGDGLDTTNASEFCDPRFDKQVAHAAALQTIDPPAANAMWARLDRELTNLAIWLPTVTPNEIDLLSLRVGNYQYNPAWGVLLDQLWVR